MLFFFILIQMTMPVFGTFWFGLMLFKVSENHYPVASMSTGSGPTVNPLALNSLAKKKWSGIWEVLKIMASTLKRQWDILCGWGEQEGKSSAFLLKKCSHCLENCWERKKQLHLSPKLDVDSKENNLQPLVADLADVTQATATSRTVLVTDCLEMQSIDSYTWG